MDIIKSMPNIPKISIKKITIQELDELENKRFKLYDEILSNISLEKSNNFSKISNGINEINIINDIIEFYCLLNRYVYNLELNINIECECECESILQTTQTNLIKIKIFISNPTKSEKIFYLPKEYVQESNTIDTIDITDNQTELRKQLEWIKCVKISSFVDKLKNKFLLTKSNKPNKLTKSNELDKFDKLDKLDELDKSTMFVNEISHYKSLIKYSYDNLSDVNFFLKGGFVIGFKLIQLICTSTNIGMSIDPSTPKQIIFDTLEFVRDFDIIMCMGGDNHQEYQNKLEKFLSTEIVSNYFRKEGQIVVVLRDKNNTKTISNPNESFIEMSIKNCSNPHKPSHLIDLEIPLTSMMIKISEQNIESIFSIIKSYRSIHSKSNTDLNNYLDNDFYFELVNKINSLEILVPNTNKFGLIDVDSPSYSSNDTKLSTQMIGLIEKTSIEISENQEFVEQFLAPIKQFLASIKQFLASMIIQPDRLFVRLVLKNIPKSIKCKKILSKYSVDKTEINWLLDEQIITNIIIRFLSNLSVQYVDWRNLNTLENKHTSSSINKFISKSNIELLDKTLFSGCNLGRLIGEIDKISNCGDFDKMVKVYDLLKIIFGQNQTQRIRNNFNPTNSTQSNILNVQKSFNNLVENIIWNKIKSS